MKIGQKIMEKKETKYRKHWLRNKRETPDIEVKYKEITKQWNVEREKGKKTSIYRQKVILFFIVSFCIAVPALPLIVLVFLCGVCVPFVVEIDLCGKEDENNKEIKETKYGKQILKSNTRGIEVGIRYRKY